MDRVRELVDPKLSSPVCVAAPAQPESVARVRRASHVQKSANCIVTLHAEHQRCGRCHVADKDVALSEFLLKVQRRAMTTIPRSNS